MARSPIPEDQRHDPRGSSAAGTGAVSGRDPLVVRLKARLGLGRMIGESSAFVAAVKRVSLLADCDSSVLVRGETGTGKELFARAIHQLGARADHPFLAINCGALPVDLVENELFGHHREAFTGAARQRPGLVEAADGGTLLLDEVDSLPANAQVKLLRFLDDGEYRPLGAARSRRADVRVIAATNGDLEALVSNGRLRADLFYRLDVLPLELPPLRRRGGDILLLARHFLDSFAAERGGPVPELSDGAAAALLAHDWPGNVRELKHVIERALLLAAGGPTVERSHVVLPLAPAADAAPVSFGEAKRRVVEQFERRYLEDLLDLCGGNVSRAARTAKKHRRALFELMRKHGIEADRYRQR